MKKFCVYRTVHHRWSILLITLLCLWGCSKDKPTNPTVSDKQITIPGLPEDPGRGNLSGKILGTLNQEPLAGVQVSIASRTTMSDDQGIFLLEGVGEGNLAVTISGEQVYPRIAVTNTSLGRSVQLDAIETQSKFHLDFYRELARGNHPSEREIFPIQRWTTPRSPTFYIDTNPSATDTGMISPDTIERTRSVIKQILPVMSGGLYSTAEIHTKAFTNYNFDTIPENSIVISFDDALYRQGALGVTFTEPTFTTPPEVSLHKAWIFLLSRDDLYQSGGINREEITAHELGHSFGYRHTSLLPSVMQKYGAYGALFSEHDRLHMAVIYKRPFGNLDIDTDPLPNGKAAAWLPEKQVFVEHAEGASSSTEVLEHLQESNSILGNFLSNNSEFYAVD